VRADSTKPREHTARRSAPPLTGTAVATPTPAPDSSARMPS